MAFAWQCTSVNNPPYIAAYAYTFRPPIDVETVISYIIQEPLKELPRVSEATYSRVQ